MAAETTDTSHQDLPQSPQQTAAAPHSRGRGLLAGRGEWLFVIVALAATTVIRFILAFRGWPFVNSDEATLGLMVDDILWHGAHPAFTYGLHHLGAIDAYLQAFFLATRPYRPDDTHRDDIPNTFLSGHLLSLHAQGLFCARRACHPLPARVGRRTGVALPVARKPPRTGYIGL